MRGSSIGTDEVSAVLLVVEYVVFVVGLAVALVGLSVVGAVSLSIALGAKDLPRAAEGTLALVGAFVGAAVGKVEEITDTDGLVVGDFVGEVKGLALIEPVVTRPTVTGLTVTGELVTTFNVGPAV
jgi:hypothetical protein